MNCGLILSFLIFVGGVCEGSLEEFFVNLPGEMEKAFKGAWLNIVKAIKKPIRFKRPGRFGNRRKANGTFPRFETTTSPTYMPDDEVIENFYSRRLRKTDGLTLPLIPRPKWRYVQFFMQSTTPNWLLEGEKEYNGRSRYQQLRRKTITTPALFSISIQIQPDGVIPTRKDTIDIS